MGRRAGLVSVPATIAIALTVGLSTAPRAGQFQDEQREYPRVEQAFSNQLPRLESLFAERDLPFPPREIYLRVIKRERVIEIWARPDLDAPFAALTELPICHFSGLPGPKRREGDRQHPEGFYTIDRFNPRSSYHLSLRISYPNDSDEILGFSDDLGGDIYIHGGCGSTGCLAITDDGAELLYVLAVLARDNGQQAIPIHTFPIAFTEENLDWLRGVTQDRELWQFWGDLQAAYEFFETHRQVPHVTVDAQGRYHLSDFGATP